MFYIAVNLYHDSLAARISLGFRAISNLYHENPSFNDGISWCRIQMTPSLRIAFEDLQLERIAVVYPGTKRFPIAPSIEAVPLREVWSTGVFPEEAN